MASMGSLLHLKMSTLFYQTELKFMVLLFMMNLIIINIILLLLSDMNILLMEPIADKIVGLL